MSIFNVQEDKYTSFGELYGKKHTCSVCGSQWVTDHRNDSWTQTQDCGHLYLVKEWDGEVNVVHAENNGLCVHIIYMDGTINDISVNHFNKICIGRA